MKKFFLIAFCAFMLTGMTITASNAAVTFCPPDSACPCKDWDLMKDNADTQRVKDDAANHQFTKQNDNSVGMTCFDRALKLSSRLGQIFSDTYPNAGFGAANTAVFGNTLYANGGSSAKKLLAEDFNSVVAPIAASHAGNFADSLSSFLGATILSAMSSFTSGLSSMITTVQSAISAINGVIGTLQGYINTLQTVLDLLGVSMPTIIPTIVGLINTWWSTIQSFIDGAIKAAQQAIKDAVDAITSFIMGAATSLLGSIDAKMDCSRLSELWGMLPSSSSVPDLALTSLLGGAWPPSSLSSLFRPIEGGGLEQGTPYFTLFDLVKPGGPSGVGTAMMNSLTNSVNQPILQKAYDDITGSGALAAPGNDPDIWPSTPDLTGKTVTQIIAAMASP
ncbi:MAG: hypothetical protein GC185_01340 [Alphaproteobacteria bacterium]|nr:hypothetical protein [Alphaproteobacteria bacterium]